MFRVPKLVTFTLLFVPLSALSVGDLEFKTRRQPTEYYWQNSAYVTAFGVLNGENVIFSDNSDDHQLCKRFGYETERASGSVMRLNDLKKSIVPAPTKVIRVGSDGSYSDVTDL